MARRALTTASTLMCPHGGTVTAMAAGPATAQSATLLCATDGFTIAGCAFSTPAGPMPCLTVQWVAPDLRVTVAGAATLSEGSVGLCMNAASAPQGTVMVVVTQPRVETA